MGFPCNQFGAQEPGTNAEILSFVQDQYDVDFPMFAKIDVKGPGQAPLYRLLTEGAPQPDGTTDIRWNFEKFLVARDGRVVQRFGTKVTPEQLAPDVLAELKR